MFLRFARTAVCAAFIAAASAAIAPASAADTILLGTVGSGSALNWPVYIAIAKGFAKQEGLEIEFVSAPSSAAIQQQIAAGSVAIGEGGLPDPIRAIDKGAPVSILRVQAKSSPYALLAKPSIKSYADLKGKVISLGGIKDITRIYLERMLVANGVKPGEYDSVYAGATSARYAALESGAVDAAILTSPFNFTAEAKGFVRLGLTVDYVKDFPFSGYSMNTPWALAHRDQVIRFSKMIAEAIDWFNNPANKEEGVAILVKGAAGTRLDDADKTWDFYHDIKIYDRDGSPADDGLANLVKILKDLGDVEGDTKLSRFYDPALVGK